MIKFDRIKLLTNDRYISGLNQNLVDPTTKPYTINQKYPFNIYIQLIPLKHQAVIEFSAKILLDDYPNLITANTIYQCFENINKMGLCKLEIENIINDSRMLSCDITNDIDGIILPNDFRYMLIANLKNVSNYIVRKYLSSGYSIENQLKTPHLKLRLSIYKKHKELQKSTNKGFIKMLKNPNKLMDYFKDKYRIETNLKNFRQINDYCGTTNNYLMDILNSTTNPLIKIFDNIFVNDSNESDHIVSDNSTLFDFESLNQLRDALLLKECGNDLKLVKEVLNIYYSPKTNKRKYISGYKKLLNQSPRQSINKYMIGQIRNKLIA